ncbi:hypothetical protein FJ366_02095 [Candidatus Dependentiae bacterium]|nr:hypothetical protein [Candidatus Dependentiae bacterium]
MTLFFRKSAVFVIVLAIFICFKSYGLGPITNNLIYASPVDEYTKQAVEIYFQNIDIPAQNIPKNPTVVTVPKSEIDLLKSSWFNRAKNLSSSKKLFDLFCDEDLSEEVFFIKTETELIGVSVTSEQKSGSYRTNWWRFYALQSPLPSGFWFTPNGLDLHWTTRWTYDVKKITLFSSSGNLSDEALALIKASTITSSASGKRLMKNIFCTLPAIFVFALIVAVVSSR